MMTDKFDFDKIVERRGTNSYKWDSLSDENILPMWVADMDFRTAPAIVDALRRRVEHGVFGYTRVPQAYYDALVGWFDRRHGWQINRDMVIYTSGVVPAISAVIKALTRPGDGVIVQTPVYNCFFSSIRNNGCVAVHNPLIYTGDSYVMDYDDLERKVAGKDVKLLLLCNPHNPAGRVWKRHELERLGAICASHGVTVVSDEIHCELVYKPNRYTPFGTLPEELRSNAVICCSPTKAFNIAGLQIANIVAPCEAVRARIDKAININEVCDVNPFGVEALVAAYNHGEEWLDALLDYLHDNYMCLCAYFAVNMPQLTVTKLEGTYLVWVDCSSLGIDSLRLETELLETEQLWLNAGDMYGDDRFMRINIACPRTVMLKGLERLRRYVVSLQK